ncbi:MAG: amidohydrolase family protein [Novosphingobium sp.]|nr:amidohydrolase family protein [Novosphingobium sp.]
MDLAIRNATIVDGTGGDRYKGDIGVEDGLIVALGKVEGSAREEIDAGGMIVSPGFIDCHTHYDAQICWDDMLSPSVYHGVTTAIGGNCGFTLAPLSGQSDDLDYLMDMLAVVEGMPVASLREAVKPSWTSFGGFLDHFDGKLAINTAFMVGHCALRRCVMGERAVGHEATPAELEQMTDLLRQCIAEGGLGLSTSTSISHSDHNGDPVPSRFASEEELLTLSGALRDYPGTLVEIVPGVGPFVDETENAMVTNMSLAAQRVVNWNAIFVDVSRQQIVDSQLATGRYAAERGAKVYGLVQSGPLEAVLNFRSGFTFAMLDGWKPFLSLPLPDRIKAMQDPEMRARLKQGAENPDNPVQVLKDIDKFVIGDVRTEKNAQWRGRQLKEYAASVGMSNFDALFNLAVEEELFLTFSGPDMGADEASWKLREQVWNDENVLLGGSDAGAHVDMFNTFALTTQLLGTGVRERGVLSLEDAVRRITGELADAFGITNRGYIAEGTAADLVVFDADTIDCGPISMRDDLPCGESRLYGDAIGIHHVIVNGVPVAEGNSPTGRKGGKMLRSGTDTYTVALA